MTATSILSEASDVKSYPLKFLKLILLEVPGGLSGQMTKKAWQSNSRLQVG